MVGSKNVESEMFNFSTKLFFHKHAISKKTGYVSLYVEVYISNSGRYDQERFPLKLKWPHDKVDRERGALLPRHRFDPDVNDYNMIVMDQRARYNEIAKMYRLANRMLDMESFRRELRFNDPTKSLVKFMEDKRTELFAKKQISLQTWKNVGSTIRILEEYKPLIRFDELNGRWMRDFKSWLMKRSVCKDPNSTRTHKPGTIWTRIRDLKAYLALANEEVSISVDEHAINFPNPEPQQITVYCNRDEVRRLLILLRSGYLTDMQHRVLKAFLFTCFTSLRISDLYRANTQWMVSDNLLVFTQRKNMDRKPKKVRIPLNSIARALVDETSKTFFDLPTEQEYNRTMKELAEKADIRKNLTSHVGRHTFGYLYMTTVGNLYGLKEILGHKKISTTERYAHLDDEYELQQVVKLEEGFEDLTVSSKVRRIS